MALRSLATKFANLTKDLPVKLPSITKLERNGSNFQLWELEFMSYVVFAPDMMMYKYENVVPGTDGYKEDFEEVVNSLIHWAIDCEVELSLVNIQAPSARVAELWKQFAGVPFAVRQSSSRILTTTIFNAKSGLLDTHLMTMQLIRDKLKRVGVLIPDNVFALHVANSMPGDLPDVSISFEGSLLHQPQQAISTSVFCRELEAAEVAFHRKYNNVEAMKAAVVEDLHFENRRCNYCVIWGHLLIVGNV